MKYFVFFNLEEFNYRQADFRLMRWLNAQEDNYSLVIYECDYTATNWTRRCLRQADAIFVVANGEVEPPEQQFVNFLTRFLSFNLWFTFLD